LAQETDTPDPVTAERTLRSDLRNMVLAQESFYADHNRYAKSTSELMGEDLYEASEGVTVVVILSSERGWNGVAVDERIPGLVCGVWVGMPGPPLDDGAEEGEPTCTTPDW
jgi:hypothetical protein